MWLLLLLARVYAAPTTSFLVDVGLAPRPQTLALASVFTRVVGERCNSAVAVNASGLVCAGAPLSAAPFAILLRLDGGLGAEAFAISPCAAAGGVLIEGGDDLGLVYALGEFLHTSTFEEGGVIPSPWRGAGKPRAAGSMRAAYLATHFYNFFQAAPPDRVAAYVEDLALWGLNTVLVTIPLQQFTGLADPALAALLSLQHTIFASSKAVGLRVGLILVPNQGFSTRASSISYTPFPDPLGVRGHLGFLTCAHVGRSYLEDANSALLANFSQLDTLLFWPYDEGGCGCKNDWPWGARGFPALSSDVLLGARARFGAGLHAVLSTWMFDQPPAGEFDGLDALLRANATPPFDAVMADNHGDFPPWPLTHGGAPGGLPLYNFPEISMWGRNPWGGFGANPLPGRFQSLWDETKGLVTGGAPYSEGIYNDINLVVAVRHYWDGAAAVDTVAAYVAFEFGAASVAPVTAAIALLEGNWPNDRVSPSALNASAALEAVDAALPGKQASAWRWRQLLLRARIDVRLLANSGRVTCSDTLMVAAFKELAAMYYASSAFPAVRPPCT